MAINNRTVIIGIVAGEVSGDILGSGLIRSLKKYLKKVHFFGIGGIRMRTEQMECWYDISELSVMGIIEVMSKLPRILNIRRKLINRFVNLKPDIFIGIDSPDFNIFLEKCLKKKGICTIHYVSPSIWAWRENRIFDIKKAVDSILVLFPFEKSIYDRFKIPCHCVGHTLADEIPLYPNKIFMRKKLGISKNSNCLALLPGSRIKEIKMLTYHFLACVELLNNNIPNLEVLVPLHNQILVDQFVKLASSTTVKFRILDTQKAWEVMTAADISLLTSGTITLECMLSKCPMVVAYRMNFITFMLIKILVKTPWISLPNLLAGYGLVPECIQKDCTPKKLASTLFNVFNHNTNQRLILQNKFYQLHQSIKLNANEQVAHVILRYIKL